MSDLRVGAPGASGGGGGGERGAGLPAPQGQKEGLGLPLLPGGGCVDGRTRAPGGGERGRADDPSGCRGSLWPQRGGT